MLENKTRRNIIKTLRNDIHIQVFFILKKQYMYNVFCV